MFVHNFLILIYLNYRIIHKLVHKNIMNNAWVYINSISFVCQVLIEGNKYFPNYHPREGFDTPISSLPYSIYLHVYKNKLNLFYNNLSLIRSASTLIVFPFIIRNKFVTSNSYFFKRNFPQKEIAILKIIITME